MVATVTFIQKLLSMQQLFGPNHYSVLVNNDKNFSSYFHYWVYYYLG